MTRLSPEELREAVKRSPLVGLTAAAKLLGIAPPNFSRYADRLTAIPVEGSAKVYVKAEVVALARKLARERERRHRDTAA